MLQERVEGQPGAERRFVWGAGTDELLVQENAAGSAMWAATDRLGSTVAVSNDAGGNLARYSYGPFGEPSVLAGPTFRYTGQRLDADSGLYYYKARWYSPYLGRFLETDPIGTADASTHRTAIVICKTIR